MSWIHRHAKVFLPIGVLVVGGLVAAVLILTKPRAERRAAPRLGPLVRVMNASAGSEQITVRSQGTVEPRTEISLVAEVAGRVVSVSPSLEEGGYFHEGDVLLTIDPRDYELAVVQARGQVTRAELLLAREKAEGELAREEWNELGDGGGDPLTLREPQLADARAALATAQAVLGLAELRLERTSLRAPFTGRVRKQLADVGQYVAPGAAIAVVYAIDYAEIRLPLPDDRLAHLDIPLIPGGAVGEKAGEAGGPAVRLSARVGGADRSWWGRIVRTEGQVDRASRMTHVVARVDDPYGIETEQSDSYPLLAGLFVEAVIEGRGYENVYRLPRGALRSKDRVYVVEEGRLYYRPVHVLAEESDAIIVDTGLVDGDRICLSPLDVAVDGMTVRVAGDESDTSVTIPAGDGSAP